jgi:prevent-host-death family protein
MITATIFEAKTRLSELIKKAEQGEEVVITSGREKKPVARLQPIQPAKVQRLGLLYDSRFELGEAFWEPLPEDAMGLGTDDLL